MTKSNLLSSHESRIHMKIQSLEYGIQLKPSTKPSLLFLMCFFSCLFVLVDIIYPQITDTLIQYIYTDKKAICKHISTTATNKPNKINTNCFPSLLSSHIQCSAPRSIPMHVTCLKQSPAANSFNSPSLFSVLVTWFIP